jgi:hypothetical protein
VRIAAHLVFAALAIALSLHLIPGFHNPRVIAPTRFTPDAVPFTMYLNFDKPLVGLWLLWTLPWVAPEVPSGARCASARWRPSVRQPLAWPARSRSGWSAGRRNGRPRAGSGWSTTCCS